MISQRSDRPMNIGIGGRFSSIYPPCQYIYDPYAAASVKSRGLNQLATSSQDSVGHSKCTNPNTYRNTQNGSLILATSRNYRSRGLSLTVKRSTQNPNTNKKNEVTNDISTRRSLTAIKQEHRESVLGLKYSVPSAGQHVGQEKKLNGASCSSGGPALTQIPKTEILGKHSQSKTNLHHAQHKPVEKNFFLRVIDTFRNSFKPTIESRIENQDFCTNKNDEFNPQWEHKISSGKAPNMSPSVMKENNDTPPRDIVVVHAIKHPTQNSANLQMTTSAVVPSPRLSQRTRYNTITPNTKEATPPSQKSNEYRDAKDLKGTSHEKSLTPIKIKKASRKKPVYKGKISKPVSDASTNQQTSYKLMPPRLNLQQIQNSSDEISRQTPSLSVVSKKKTLNPEAKQIKKVTYDVSKTTKIFPDPDYSPPYGFFQCTKASSARLGKQIKFSWTIARALIKLQMQPAETYSLNGVPWSMWNFQSIPTLGYTADGRVQEMYKASLYCPITKEEQYVFIKLIPVSVWKTQWENENHWKGEYVTNSENFVMEAAALAFLNQYSKGLAPRLHAILELSTDIPAPHSSSPARSSRRHTTSTPKYGKREITHIAIVSELYGKDLMGYFCSRSENLPLTDNEKLCFQYECVTMLRKLHEIGLAHLDLTPENVLYGKQGLRLCDFAKATPLHTSSLRHSQKSVASEGDPLSQSHSLHTFESCEPTIGKGAYMPPECWEIYWKLEAVSIRNPLDELMVFTEQTERSSYYFNVELADTYMIGVLLLWIWSGYPAWSFSDVTQDEDYNFFVRTNLNFDSYSCSYKWPVEFKSMLRGILQPDPKQRLRLPDILSHTWFDQLRPNTARERQSRKIASSDVRFFTTRNHYNQNQALT